MIYLDTSCLLKLYYPEPDSERVSTLVTGQTIALTSLHQLEFSNALQLKWRQKSASKTQVVATQALLDEDIRAGVVHRTAVDWEEIWRRARTLAETYTRTVGCRSLDILHCAVAFHCGIRTFVTGDLRQRRLAQKIGLKSPTP